MAPSIRRPSTIRGLLAVALLALAGGACAQALPPPAPTVYGYEIVNTYPHDTSAFTQGLLYRDGHLYESTGLNGRSSLRKVELETGKVLRMHRLVPEFFAEGLVDWQDSLIQITWHSGVGIVYDLATFEERRRFSYPGEGWGISHDGRRLIMSDGTSQLRFLDPDTLAETGRLTVRFQGQELRGLNELEYIDGRVWANVWPTDHVVMIDPDSGHVTGHLDLGNLLPRDQRRTGEDVLNGIAWDAAGKRLFVTGKNWPQLFELKVTAKP